MEYSERAKLKKKLKENHQQAVIMHREDFESLFEPLVPMPSSLDDVKNWAGYYPSLDDAATLVKQYRELGGLGSVIERTVNGQRYVVIKGDVAVRQILTKIQYTPYDTKIVSLALGKVGTAKSIIDGAKLSIYLTVPFTVLKCFLEDEMTLGALVGNVSSDLIKIGISTITAAIAMTAPSAMASLGGSVATFAAGPLAVALFVGVVTSIILNRIDERYGLTQALINCIDETYNDFISATFGAVARKITEIQRIMIWQVANGVRPGKGLISP